MAHNATEDSLSPPSSDDFKPLSVDHSKPGRLKVGEGDEVNVSLPVVQVGGCNQTHNPYIVVPRVGAETK